MVLCTKQLKDVKPKKTFTTFNYSWIRPFDVFGSVQISNLPKSDEMVTILDMYRYGHPKPLLTT